MAGSCSPGAESKSAVLTVAYKFSSGCDGIHLGSVLFRDNANQLQVANNQSIRWLDWALSVGPHCTLPVHPSRSTRIRLETRSTFLSISPRFHLERVFPFFPLLWVSAAAPFPCEFMGALHHLPPHAPSATRTMESISCCALGFVSETLGCSRYCHSWKECHGLDLSFGL